MEALLLEPRGYRDDGYGMALRAEAFRGALAGVAARPEVRAVRAGRAARTAMGAWLAAGAVAMFAAAALGPDRSASVEVLLGVLLGVGPVGLAAWALGRYRAAASLAAGVEAVVRRDAQGAGDGAEAIDLRALLERVFAEAGAPSGRSEAWLLAGVSLMAPLTLHAGVALVFGHLSGFGEWIAISGLVVGHCHLILAVLGWRYAHRVAAGGEFATGWGAVGWVTLCSAIPGVLLFVVPVVLVLLTASLFVPLAWAMAAGLLRDDAMTLDGATLPDATLSDPTLLDPVEN